MERKCGACEKTKPVTEFYRDGKNPDGSPKYRRDCKECYRVTRVRAKLPPKKVVPRRKRR